MRLRWLFVILPAIVLAGWMMAQPAADPMIEGYRQVEVASVSDAMEALYGLTNYMSQDMRPLFRTKFAGPAVTVLMKPREHKESSAGSQGMLDAIDNAAPGSVYVIVLENGVKYAAIGGLMSTAMKVRGFAGAVLDGSARDLPQINRIQFPVFARGVAPSTTVNHFYCAGVNVEVKCAGATVKPGDIVVADDDGVVVVPKDKAAEVLKKAQANDDTEHRQYPFIEKYKSIKKAVEEFGRI